MELAGCWCWAYGVVTVTVSMNVRRPMLTSVVLVLMMVLRTVPMMDRGGGGIGQYNHRHLERPTLTSTPSNATLTTF